MSERSFPALGFDPAEGDTGAVAAVRTSVDTARVQLQEVAGRMAEALQISDDWDGDAADDFHDYGDDLPQAFNTGAEFMQKVAEALTTWAGQLATNQARADELERKAKELKEKLKAADLAVDETAGAYGRATGADKAPAYDAYLKAVDQWSTINEALQRVIDDANRLKSKHLREANAAASAIRGGPDDAFEPENDGWFVQALDGTAKVSGIVSTASAAIAAGSLLIPGVGEVVAPVAGTISGVSAGVNGIAGVLQTAAGSRNKPSPLDIALTLVPGRTVTSGAVGLARGAAKGGLKEAGKQGAEEAGKGFTSAGIGAAVKNVREIRELSRNTGSVKEALAAKGSKDLLEKGENIAKAFGKDEVSDATKRGLGQLRSSHEAFAATVDTTVRSLDAAGVELTPAQKRELELLKLATNPGRSQLENAAVNIAKETAKEQSAP